LSYNKVNRYEKNKHSQIVLPYQASVYHDE